MFMPVLFGLIVLAKKDTARLYTKAEKGAGTGCLAISCSASNTCGSSKVMILLIPGMFLVALLTALCEYGTIFARYSNMNHLLISTRESKRSLKELDYP
jgi:hypothetical protein